MFDFIQLLNHLTLLVPNVGEVEMLSRLLNKNTPDDCILKLYSNDKTPAEADILTDYTEVVGFGYLPVTLTGANWTVATASGVTTGEYSEQSIVFSSGPVDVYGYFITNNAGDELLWAERFDTAPYNVPGGGGTIKVTAKIELE